MLSKRSEKVPGFYKNQEAKPRATGQLKELVSRLGLEISLRLTRKNPEPSFRLDLTKKQREYLYATYKITKRFKSMNDFYIDQLEQEQYSKSGKIKYSVESFQMRLGNVKTLTVYRKRGVRELLFRQSDLVVKFEIRTTHIISDRIQGLIKKNQLSNN
jgi:hypothetical protein